MRTSSIELLHALNRIIEEHQAIRSHMGVVGEAVNDHEACLSLQQFNARLAENVWEPPGARQKQVFNSLTVLEEGLRSHYAHEEEFLPPILGELLMEALKKEHKELLIEIESARATVARSNPEALTPDQQIIELMLAGALVSRMLRLKEHHLAREEAIFALARRSLEARTEQEIPGRG